MRTVDVARGNKWPCPHCETPKTALQGGMRTADVARAINGHVRTVRRLRQRYRETGRTADHPRSGRPPVTTFPPEMSRNLQVPWWKSGGETVFKCPLCEEEWPYDEVRKSAKLTNDERIGFEDVLGTNAARKSDRKDCPGCGTFIERLDTSSLGVECFICTKRIGKIYKFCWQCLREWKGLQPCAEQCENVGCNINDQEQLKDCSMVTLRYIENVQCPAIRACPCCGVLIAHSNVGCKIMTCHKCHNKFCFLCLKPAQECLKTSTPYVLCISEVAPKQVEVVRF
ncbi:uncharacterized protein [Garra rufa]|uniref:uncharacterized protein n=1 Tax=Garra rufa TaxID=137080 RepID=UPI003CCE9631